MSCCLNRFIGLFTPHKRVTRLAMKNLCENLLRIPFRVYHFSSRCGKPHTSQNLTSWTEFLHTLSLQSAINLTLHDNEWKLRCQGAFFVVFMALTTFPKPSSLVDRLIDELESDDLERRREAIHLLRSARPISALCRALRNSRGDLRSILLCDILATIRHRAAVPDLIATLNDQNVEVRAAAANALGNIGDPRAVLALIRLLQNRAEPVFIRDTAAYGLGMTRSPDAVPTLLDALDDAAPSVRRCTAEALGRCGDERVLPTLQDILQHDNEGDSVKADVTSAIEAIRRRITS